MPARRRSCACGGGGPCGPPGQGRDPPRGCPARRGLWRVSWESSEVSCDGEAEAGRREQLLVVDIADHQVEQIPLRERELIVKQQDHRRSLRWVWQDLLAHGPDQHACILSPEIDLDRPAKGPGEEIYALRR